MKPLMLYPSCYVCGLPSEGKISIFAHNLKAEAYGNRNLQCYTRVDLPACGKHKEKYEYKGARMDEYFVEDMI